MRVPAKSDAPGHGIDRTRKVTFTFDGKPMTGCAGDTLASALMANDKLLVGRSFKYHRPRGLLTCGSEEPNALVQVGPPGLAHPNQRATMVELYDGLQATSQNAWPSLDYDLLSINDVAAPFLGAGFYYKTFMWPKRFWEKLYEPLIRRAAGLGALPNLHDDDLHEKAFAHCDLLVIGGGPAGLMAALAAAEAGAQVILADEHASLGGRLLLEVAVIDGKPAHQWAAEMETRLRAYPNVRVMTRTTVTGAYDHGVFGALERVSRHIASTDPDLPLDCFWRITARASVLATGAIERPIPFPNNDRPGILMASALRGYVNKWGVTPGKSVAIYGQGRDALQTAHDLQRAGVDIAALINTGPDIEADLGFPVTNGGKVTGTKGRKGLKQITVQVENRTREVFADAVAMAGGWTPSVHLSCHMNGRPRWRDDIQAFVPGENAVPGMIAAGACLGEFDTAGCLKQGLETSINQLKNIGKSVSAPLLPDVEETDTGPHVASGATAIRHVSGKGRAWLDFQNDVTVKDVELAARESYSSVEHMKRYTTQGMAPDQGKNSNINALSVLADVTGRSIPDTGTTTYRPPFVPVPIAALGAGARGKGFAPERHMTSHAASVARGAPMIEAGLWYRPSYFPEPGEKTWRQSCDREVMMVRNAVGVCDVSTLGKIDIQGPDAAAFLDFVYTNTFSTLKEGKVRYGLMLREDGHVLDDGTTARLGPDHFLMTTTTAAAGPVMKHLDFVSQCLAPDWDVNFTSVTEQWAQFAIAGPLARRLLNAILDTPLSSDDLPYMGCMTAGIGGVEGRVFRISFSGEHAYEIAVPSRYGDGLFRQVLAQAETLGGGAYGMEALNVLRIEKGFITHAEIHGRVTAFDIGMERMVSKRKACVGQTMAARPGLMDPSRARLVGLKLDDPKNQLLGGAHLFEADAEATRENSQGYITSMCWSPTLQEWRALAFLEHGPDRLGEVIRVTDHMRDVQTAATVAEVVPFDPMGGRLRGKAD